MTIKKGSKKGDGGTKMNKEEKKTLEDIEKLYPGIIEVIKIIVWDAIFKHLDQEHRG